VESDRGRAAPSLGAHALRDALRPSAEITRDSARNTADAAGAGAEDAALVARIAQGDWAATGALYDKHAPALLAVSVRILRDRAEAEDAVHDAFVQMSNRAAQYSPERGSVVAWLVTLTRNLCIDRVRRRDRRRVLARAAVVGEPTVAEMPLSLVVDHAARAAIAHALDGLTAEQRQTLEQIFFEGLSMPEVAAAQGVPLGTIKSRVARALSRLRETLARQTRGAGPLLP